MNTSAVTFVKGSYNPAGLTKVYYAVAADVATFPALPTPATATTFASLVELATAITMKTGKQFNELYCTLETGELKATLQGSRDGKSYENSAAIMFPGNDSNFLGFKAYAANQDFIFIIKEKNGKLRVLGSLEDPATMDSDDESSGKKTADSRGSTITFKATGPTSAPIYTLAIDSLLTPAAAANGGSGS